MARDAVVHLGSRRAALLALATAVCAALVGAAVVPAHGAEPPGDGTPTVAGDFAIGDGLEGLIDEESGSFGVTLAVGGLDVRWDSRAAAAGDRFGLGEGWGYQLGFVDTEGGTRLVPPSWGEVFEADASAPSGLRGYTLEDLTFRRLEADAVPAVPAAVFALHELGGTSTYFSAAGDPVAAVSRHGEQTTWEWSGTVPHRLLRVVDADGVVTTLDWASEAGTLIVRPGSNVPIDAGEPDRAWRVRFDGRGAIAAVVEPTGDRTEFDYHGAELTRISNPAGARTRIEWQRFDDRVPRVRRVSTSDPAGEQLSARAWDRFGAALPSGWPLLEGMDASFGAGGSADAGFGTVLSDGVTSVRSEYSGDGLLGSRDVLVAAAEGERVLRREILEYPADGGPGGSGGSGEAGAGPASGTLRSRPIASTSVRLDASGAERDERTSFEYDGFGRVVEQQLVDGTGQASGGTREVDALGRTRSETDQVGRVTGFEYTLDGLVSRASRTDGQVIAHEYDPRTRARTRTTTTSPIGATVDVATEYDPHTGDVVSVFDPGDRRGTEIVFSYDAHGNLLSVTYPDGATIRYGYDVHGRRTMTTDSAGNATAYEYDRSGALVRAVQHDATGAELARVEYELDDLGRVARVVRGNGVVTELTHTSAGEIATETTRSGDDVLSDRAYTYDPRGLVTQRVDRVIDERGALGSTTTTYRYDERERLVESSVTHRNDDTEPTAIEAQPKRTTSYDLSVAGDVTAETVVESVDGAERSRTRRFDYSPAGELTAIIDDSGRVEQRYDAAGNLVEASGGTTLSYDAADRPTTETTRDGAVIETTYWADGSRRSLSTTGLDGIVRSTEFTWDGDELIGETHRVGDERSTAAYLLGAGRQARTTIAAGEPDTAYYGTDRHGNVTELTSVDGQIIERYAYGDYGAEISSAPGDSVAAPACSVSPPGDADRNPFRYSGEYTDPTCRQHLRARSYDPVSMRFTSPDAAAVMNPYAYTDANPISRIDPTGHSSEEDRGGVLSPEKWGWNFATLVLSFAGLVGTGLSFLAPLKGYQIAMLVIAGIGDGMSGVTAAVRWGLEHQIDGPTADRLGEFDIFAGAAIVGIGFAARAGFWYYAKREAAQRAERRLATLFAPDPTGTPKRGPGSGGSDIGWNGVPLEETGEQSPLVMNSTRYSEVQLPHRDRSISETSTAGTLVPETLRAKQTKARADLLLRSERMLGRHVRQQTLPSSPAHETPAASLTHPSTDGLTTSPGSKPVSADQPVPSSSILDGGPKTDELTNVLDLPSITTLRYG